MMEKGTVTIPLYDLFDGLGRRRRMRRLGYESTEPVTMLVDPQTQEREVAAEQKSEAA